MTRPVLLACVMLVLGSVAAEAATVRIVEDRGGRIGNYVRDYTALKHSGERVAIDGPCLSACTLILGFVPRERICVTRQARLGFHAAWNPGANGATTISDAGTRFLMDVYPGHVRSWLARKGGLSRQMVYLEGRELAAMYPRCR